METTAFFKDRQGIVQLKGAFTCPAAGTVAFQLPAGYRPESGAAANGAKLSISGPGAPPADGAVLGGAGCELAILDGTTFRAAS